MSSATARKAWNEAMKATAGAALPASLQQRTQKRRSGRNKKQERRTKARKVQTLGDDSKEYRAAVWMDALEEVDLAATIEENDEEYNELDEFDDKPAKKAKRTKTKKTGVIPKRFMPRSLAGILMDDAGRDDGAAHAFVNAEARILSKSQQLPARKFCPVTGTEGIYTEPKSNIPYSGARALEQIRERAPPWMTLGGTAAYWEAVKSIRNEE
jgi:hypothetical protein